jgi:hypothetical protein
MVIIIGYPTDSESDTDAAEPRNDITCDRSRYAPSRSRTREASTGARGPGSVLSIVLSIELVRRRLPEPRGGAALSLQYRYRNAASSLVELLALRLLGLHFSIDPIIDVRASLAPAAAGRGRCRRTRAMARRRGHGRARRASAACTVPACPRRSRHRAASAYGFLPCHGGNPVRVPYRNRHGADRSALGFRR